MLTGSIDSITWADVLGLQGNASESGYLEFKRELPGSSDGAKKEFLKDVSAFANASGGTIIYGIEERDGVAGEIVSPSVSNKDDELLRLQSSVRDGLAPRLAGFHLRWVEPDPPTGDCVLLARIQRSARAPHMVAFSRSSKFFRRVGTAVVQLDVHELRDAFLKSAVSRASTEMLREERLTLIQAGDSAVPLWEGAVLVIHCVPLRASDERGDDTAQRLAEEWDRSPGIWTPLGNVGAFSSQWSIDGFCVYDTIGEGTDKRVFRYALKMRDGTSEFVRRLSGDGAGFVVEDLVAEAVRRHRHLLQALGDDEPFVVFTSLLGVEGLRLRREREWDEELKIRPYAIDRDRVLLPEVVISGVSETEEAVDKKLTDLYQVLWQTAGMARPERRR